MSINLETGLWQDFKTQKKGNFVYLYSVLESIPFKEAKDKLTIASFLSQDREDLISVKDDCIVEPKANLLDGLDLVEISSSGVDRSNFVEPYIYLEKRKVWGTGMTTALFRKFYFVRSGLLANRIIIPYEYSGKVFYYQARTLVGEHPKYMNPPRDPANGLYTRASEILYPFELTYGPLYITEGIFDCISLQNCGLNATTTQGCHVSNFQIDILRQSPCQLVIAYDNDAAGDKGMAAFLKLSKQFRIPSIWRVSPPEEYKDWNAFYCATDEETVRNYVQTNKVEWTWEKQAYISLSEI